MHEGSDRPGWTNQHSHDAAFVAAPSFAERLKIGHIRRSIDLFRLVYLVIVVVQLSALGAYLAGLLDANVTLVPGAISSFAGTFLSFLICLHSFHHRRSNAIDIASGIVSYGITCLSFAIIYWLISQEHPEAFVLTARSAKLTLADGLYFSFVTASTTGFGDITAVSNVARAFVVWEILVGQVYQAFIFWFLASLVASPVRSSH